MHTYVKVTEKILEYYPGWQSIIDQVGIVLEKSISSVKIHIVSDEKSDLDLIYTIPIECTKTISDKEATAEALGSME